MTGTATLTGNERYPDWYAYCRDRQQRRQDHVAAIARDAGAQAPNAIERVKREDAAARAGVAEFDAAEPELTYADWLRGVA